MPTKTGMGGHASEAYDPSTGKFIEDGAPNVRHDNPTEANKIKNHISPEKIQEQSAAKQTAPTPNLGKYAEPHQERKETLRNDFGLDVKEDDEEIPNLDVEEFFDMDFSEPERAYDTYLQDYDKIMSSFVKKYAPDVSEDKINAIAKSGRIPYSVLDKMGYKDPYDKQFKEDFREHLTDYIHMKG